MMSFHGKHGVGIAIALRAAISSEGVKSERESCLGSQTIVKWKQMEVALPSK